MADQYEEAKVLHYPGMTIRVFRPILTQEERNRRMKEIEKAAVNLLLSLERGKT